MGGASSNCAAEQTVFVAHTRSEVVVGATASYSSPVHCASGTHWRSWCVAAARVSCSVPVHTVCSRHWRSCFGPAALASHCVALQTTCAWHSRSEVCEGSTATNWLAPPEAAHVVSGVHTRFACAAGGLDSHSEGVHTVRSGQWRSDVIVGSLVEYSSAVQVRAPTSSLKPSRSMMPSITILTPAPRMFESRSTFLRSPMPTVSGKVGKLPLVQLEVEASHGVPLGAAKQLSAKWQSYTQRPGVLPPHSTRFSPWPHVPQLVHSRSAASASAVLSHWSVVHVVAWLHPWSLNAVGAVDSHCAPLHVVWSLHSRSLWSPAG